jgi:hypothetical protein
MLHGTGNHLPITISGHSPIARPASLLGAARLRNEAAIALRSNAF